jgi:hypothetical protein
MQRDLLATAAAIEAIYRDRFHEFVRVAEAIRRRATGLDLRDELAERPPPGEPPGDR